MEDGNIKDLNDLTKGFGVVNNTNNVDLNDILSPNNIEQQWEWESFRSDQISSDHFKRIKNPASEKFLNAVTPDKLTIEGNNVNTFNIPSFEGIC